MSMRYFNINYFGLEPFSNIKPKENIMEQPFGGDTGNDADMSEAEFREHEGLYEEEESDGQPDELKENEDFAQDGYFENIDGSEIL